MCFTTKERAYAAAASGSNDPGIFRSMWEIGRSPDFLRVAFLFVAITTVNGIFAQLGFYLNVYWVMGSALSGATLGAWVGMLGWGLSLACLPLVNLACQRFQKHQVLAFAILWMMIGTALKWWAVDPEHPEYQFVLPLFFATGIVSVYTVLPTMLADVTDVDELNHGVRREGMFGAVNAFLMKSAAAATPILSGLVLVLCGFDPQLEYDQSPDTIFWLRIMYSFVPAGLLLGTVVVLWKYPLTRERVQEIKAELRVRREQRAAEAAEA